MSSRYRSQTPLDIKRAAKFVALDTLTAQVPLIEIVRKRPFHIRIWTAYNYERTCGSYVATHFSGLVKTVTVYESGRTVEHIVRPAGV